MERPPIREWSAGAVRARLAENGTLLLELPIVTRNDDEFAYWGDRVIPFDPSSANIEPRLLGT